MVKIKLNYYVLRSRFPFREHLGITDKNDTSVEDPVSNDFYKGVWLKQASINTDVYDKVKLIFEYAAKQ